ncbi:type I-E CRISPR-associated protein Cas6/Cse3/CasE [Streptomyces albidoflavus]
MLPQTRRTAVLRLTTPRAFEERGGLEKGTTRRSAARSDRRATGARRHVHLRTATYDGLLDVTDPDALRQTLVEGIGHGRAYGCGLLTLARCDAGRTPSTNAMRYPALLPAWRSENVEHAAQNAHCGGRSRAAGSRLEPRRR